MSQQIQITGGAKVRDLQDVIIGTSGVLSSLGFNVANGVPKLDSNAKILVSQLPNSVMEYLGTWNASTNTPTLVNGTGNAGDVYLCNVAGTTNFGAGPITFAVGDSAIYSGSIWQRAGGATGTVTSVGVSRDGDALTITGSPITTSGTINLGFGGTSGQYINGAGNLTTFPSLTGYVPYIGATADLNLDTYDIYTAKLWLNDVPNAGFGSLELTDGVLHFEDADGHSMVTMEDGYLTIANASTIRALLNVSGLSANRDYAFPNASGTIALTSDLSSYVPTSRQLTINGTAYDLSADRTWSVGTVTSVAALTLGTTGTDLSSTVATGTTTPVITLNVPTASATNRGALSSTDWSTFNSKESALTFSSPLVRTTNTISIPAATTSVNGYLTSTDWTTFNSKANALSGTINTIAYWNSSTTISSLALATYPSLTELSYVKGVTSAIQTQLGTKIPYTGTGISVYGLSAIGEYDGGSQIPAGYGGNYALTLGNGAIGNGLSLYTTGYIDAGAIRTAGYSRVTNATASTSTTTGAFVVTGGVGIGGALYGTTINLSSSITSTSFIKSGATSSDFLKGDGSIDSNTYVSSSALAGYLPLTGGTLSGTLQVGSPSATATANLAVTKTITGGTAARGILSDGVIQSDVTGSAYYYQSKAYTAAGSYTIALLSHYRAEKSSIGSSSVVTTQIGFNADNSLGTTTGGYANTNYGFYGNLSTSGFSTNYNVYMAGTAYNYFQGITGIGATPSGSYTLDVTGTGRFTTSVTAAGYVFIGLDGTYGPTYSGISFQGTSAGVNGENRIFAGRTGQDGLYLASATSRAIYFRAGGSTSDHLIIGSTGAATFSSTVNVNGATASTNLNVLGVAGTMVGTTATNQQLRITAPTTTANAGAGIRFDASSGAKEAVANIGVVNNATGNTGSLVFNVYNGGADFPEQMRITSAGNVGIGTSSPRGLLQIYGAEVSAYKTYTGQGNTGGGDTIINAYRLDSASAYLRVTDIVALGDDTNNRGSTIRLMTTNTSGSTTSALTLASTGAATFSSSVTAGGNLQVAGANTTTPLGVRTNTNQNWRLLDNSGAQFDCVNDALSARVDFRIGSQLYINASGNIGIGVSSPAYLLHAYSTNSGGARIYVQGTTNFVITQFGNSSAGAFYHGIDDSAGATFTGTAYSRFLYSSGDYPFIIAVNGTERLRITGTGNVGLTRVPVTNTLEVNGDASKSTAGLWAANSDINIKTDINTIEGALDRINKVRLVKFKYKDAYKENNQGIKDIYYHNVIAQEFKEVYADYVYSKEELKKLIL